MLSVGGIVDYSDPAHPEHSNHLISTNGRKVERVWHGDPPLFESTVHQLLMDWNRKPTEQCGFIEKECQDLFYVENVHQAPRMNFLMEKKATEVTLEHIYNTLESSVLGIFHTHPKDVPRPSPRDIVGWPNPKLKWRYFVVTSNEVLEWELV